MQSFFETEPLSVFDLTITIGTGVIVFAAVELEKLWKRRKIAEG